jgi:hypothetical protein
VPTCFEKIEKHVAKPKHAQNLQKQQLDNVVQKTCMFSNFCLIICMCFTCWFFKNELKWCTLFVLGMESTRVNPFLAKYMNYIPSNVKNLHIFKDKKSRQHYMKNYDFQAKLLNWKEKMFAIIGVLLYNSIPSCELDELYKEA